MGPLRGPLTGGAGAGGLQSGLGCYRLRPAKVTSRARAPRQTDKGHVGNVSFSLSPRRGRGVKGDPEVGTEDAKRSFSAPEAALGPGGRAGTGLGREFNCPVTQLRTLAASRRTDFAVSGFFFCLYRR